MQGGSSGVVRYRARDVLEKVLQQADSEGTMQIAGFKATIKRLEGVFFTSLDRDMCHSHLHLSPHQSREADPACIGRCSRYLTGLEMYWRAPFWLDSV